jgi:hypothetical protein
MTKPMGAVNHSTIKKLRDEYKAMWSRDWPHDDEYLKTLWRRAVAEVKMDHAGYSKKRHDVTINAMRENHEFEKEDANVDHA